MPIYHPKACYRVERDGTTVRIWGRLDRVELTPGVWPNTVELVAPIHEFSKLDALNVPAAERISGVLELYASSEQIPDVMLPYWALDYMTDRFRGRRPDDAERGVVEKAMGLIDRRWELTRGRGGVYSTGATINATDDAGQILETPGFANASGVAGDGTVIAGEPVSNYSLITKLVQFMRRPSGGPSVDVDLIPPALDDTTSTPPQLDLAWDGVPIPDELQRLCEASGAVFCLDLDGGYRIEMLGDGDLPALPAADRLPYDSNRGLPRAPSLCVVTSHPRRAINEHTVSNGDWVSGEGLRLIPIGRDTDGAYKPIEELSYVADTGLTAETLIGSDAVAVAAQQWAKVGYRLGRQWLYTAWRLVGPDASRYLPWLNRVVTTVEDATGTEARRSIGLRVVADCAVPTPDGWENAADAELTPRHVLLREGIVIFDHPIGRVAGAAEPAPSLYGGGAFRALSDGQLHVTFPHEVRGPAAFPANFYAAAYERLADGSVSSIDVGEALAAGDEDLRIVSAPDLLELRLEDAPQNTEALDARAKALAAPILTTASETETRRYRGLHAVSPNGRIAAVRWDVAAPATEIDVYTYHIGPEGYVAKADLHRLKREASGGSASSRSADRAARLDGGRDSTPRSAWAPPPATATPQGPRDVLAIVTGSTPADPAEDPTTQWHYTVWRVRISDGVGYDAVWTEYGDELDAYNLAEVAGLYIDPDHYDIDGDGTDDFGPQPIPSGSPVLIRRLDASGEGQWWIVAAGRANDVDGACPE